MKHFNLIKTFLLLFALVVGGGSSAWAEEVTYKLTLQLSDLTKGSGSGYAAYNATRTTDAICTTDNSKKIAISWTSHQVMDQNSTMQWQKGNFTTN
jgi:hypothetical protein